MLRDDLYGVLMLEYAVLDGILTYIGINYIDGVHEQNPAILTLIDAFGTDMAILISTVVTTIAITALYILSKMEWRHRYYDYITLSVMSVMAVGGVLLVVNNAVLVASG